MALEANTRPLLLGHRGCRLPGIPENSLSAFSHAIESGCDGFEFDIRASQDGRLVCLHDASLGRHRVNSTTYSQLCTENLKSSLACLEDVLRQFGESAFLDIELTVTGIEPDVAELLRRFRSKRFVISSFLPEAVSRFAELSADLPVGLIFDGLSGLRVWPNLPVQYVMPHRELVTPELVRSAREAKAKVFVWTVNRPDEMRSLITMGVDGLISDDPALLYRTLHAG